MKKPAKTYTITEAAKALGISRAAVHEAISGGRLKAKKGKITKTIVQVTQGWIITADAIKDYRVSPEHQAAGKKNE
jgi:hypothetical protein